MSGMQQWVVSIAGEKGANSYTSQEDAYEKGVKVLINTGHAADVHHWEGVWVLLESVQPGANAQRYDLAANNYLEDGVWHRKHDVHGGPHDEPPAGWKPDKRDLEDWS